MKRFLYNGNDVLLTNVQFYRKNSFTILHSLFNEIRCLITNILSFSGNRQKQFRGWVRDFDDFSNAANDTNKYLSAIIIEEEHDKKYYYSYTAAVYYKRSEL